MRKIETLGYRIELIDLPELREIRNLLDQHNKEYNEQLLRSRGREDGELNIPDPMTGFPSPFEKELTYTTARIASRIASVYKGPLEQLDATVKADRELVIAQRENELEKIEGIYQAEKDSAENAFGLRDAHRRLEAAEKRYNDFYEQLKRPPVVYFHPFVYMFLAFLIFAGEVPLNALVFQIFGENQVMTWVMACVVGLSVPLSAHFIGIKLREHAYGFSAGNSIKATVCCGIVVGALYGLSIMRQTYLGELKESLGITDTLVNSSFMFFWLNLAVFATAIMISYLAHDAAPGYQEIEYVLHRTRKEVERLERKRVELLKRAAMNRQEEKEAVNNSYRESVNRINLLKGSYDQLLKEGQEYESRCLDTLMKQVSIYRHENLKSRADKMRPTAFDVEHEFELELKKVHEMQLNEGMVHENRV
jgi:hypothetical protein